ncbi:MAG: sporulation protein YunB [Eubacteriales bacterium]|nr:sporulation protein YunB [Eubacteriales bacterium]
MKFWLQLLVIVGVLVVYLVTVVNPVVFHYADAVVDALTVQAVSCGVADVVKTDTYSSLTDIRRDANGTITSINADALAMNVLAAQVSARAQEHLTVQNEVPVPLGTFSGVPFLVGRGAPVNLRLQLIGAVNCNFESEFKSAGINQTEHKITLRSYATVDVILPLYTKRTNIVIEMLFSDSIIVGEVPEFMLTHTMS